MFSVPTTDLCILSYETVGAVVNLPVKIFQYPALIAVAIPLVSTVSMPLTLTIRLGTAAPLSSTV